MERITHGKLEFTKNNKGLREFHILADAFNTMTDQVRMRTNDLQRLLDLDSSALLCSMRIMMGLFQQGDMRHVWFMPVMMLSILMWLTFFADEIDMLITNADNTGDKKQINVRTSLDCKHRDDHVFHGNAIINSVNVMGKRGFAIAVNVVPANKQVPGPQSEQHLNAVEQSPDSLLQG